MMKGDIGLSLFGISRAKFDKHRSFADIVSSVVVATPSGKQHQLPVETRNAHGVRGVVVAILLGTRDRFPSGVAPSVVIAIPPGKQDQLPTESHIAQDVVDCSPQLSPDDRYIGNCEKKNRGVVISYGY